MYLIQVSRLTLLEQWSHRVLFKSLLQIENSALFLFLIRSINEKCVLFFFKFQPTMHPKVFNAPMWYKTWDAPYNIFQLALCGGFSIALCSLCDKLSASMCIVFKDYNDVTSITKCTYYFKNTFSILFEV